MGYLESMRADIEDELCLSGEHPADRVEKINDRINAMSVVELLERIDGIDERNLKGF